MIKMDTKTRSLLHLLHILILGCVVITAQTQCICITFHNLLQDAYLALVLF